MLPIGVQACLSLAEVGGGKLGSSVSEERLQDCVNVILSYQNSDGGWATYENTRSYSALEAGLCCSRMKLAAFYMLCALPAVRSAAELRDLL